jgi:hypothetical protein
MSNRLVILNDTDAPEAAMIALVSDVSGGGAVWTYVSTRRQGPQQWLNVQRPQDHTPIEVFGVRAYLMKEGSMHILLVERFADSRATYPDGVPRDWQKPLPNQTRVRVELVGHIRDAIEPTDLQKAEG